MDKNLAQRIESIKAEAAREIAEGRDREYAIDNELSFELQEFQALQEEREYFEEFKHPDRW